MKYYIYAADVYCARCGVAIRNRIRAGGFAPRHPREEYSYDSDSYPKGPYESADVATNSPKHCGNGADCLDAMTLTDGSKVGMFLCFPLTTEGEKRVRETHTERPSEVTSFWMDYYGLNN